MGLVRRSQGGDVAAFACLVERCQGRLRRFCRRLAGEAGLAEDLAQETLLRAFRAIGGLEEPSRFEAWLFAIAANLARKWWRRESRWPVSLESLAETYPDVPWEAWAGARLRHASPDRVFEEAEQERLLQAALDALPRPLARVLALHYLDGLNYAEVAAALEVPVSTVKGRLFKSRKRLRRELEGVGLLSALSHKAKTDTPAAQAGRKKGAVMSTTETGAANGAAAEPSLVEMMVDSIRLNLDKPHRTVMLKEKSGERYVPIIIGVPEADAIAIKLQGHTVPRPLTHDLLLAGLTNLGGTVTCVVVNDWKEQTFYGQIWLEVDGREVVLDARPSDAIALAVRASMPIFMAESVIAVGAVQAPKPGSAPAERPGDSWSGRIV